MSDGVGALVVYGYGAALGYVLAGYAVELALDLWDTFRRLPTESQRESAAGVTYGRQLLRAGWRVLTWPRVIYRRARR